MKIEESSIVETNDYRVIIYPASRPFETKEAKAITEKLFDFLATWAAHGKPLDSSFKIEKNQFIVVCVDEEKEMASGCSIDALGKIMREIDEEYKLGLFDRMKASFVQNGEVRTLKLQEFKSQLRSGELPKDIQIFDFSKNTYLDFLGHFLLPLEKSWAAGII
ncbi:hypothetical protein [Chryseobacterium vrystaatense]|uniref:ABC transporter ATPase n=1 Tax=Chryseobacterium vrystaatense TaxID=307480 RepID=A0A1M4TE43_9FLAO|nr:hypothetical protein [Chryseobacterium vrystaatense]KFF28531.1 hypothetical protein IW16_04855 [Chryseobacterium vrystaatense]SHE42713.1 hypothetical protein SAMN02787073_0333 [Chryseobacterium vrystaatense]